ncbi:unnamed protein product [Acanthosepion pharaonis]|uniref:Uncharacterized protein n=1 Tax=Acanthosepion pharaonis TaxID=158019 RepID=A0A812EGE4_ACAPH|nr:unnamed protein product [Sepia pharaonis]
MFGHFSDLKKWAKTLNILKYPYLSIYLSIYLSSNEALRKLHPTLRAKLHPVSDELLIASLLSFLLVFLLPDFPNAIHASSPLQLPALLQLSAHSCSFQHSCSLQLIPAASSTPAASSSLLQLPALLQPPAHSYSFQLTPAASSTPTASSSPQQLPAASSSPLRRSTDVPLPIPAPADDLIQHPLTSSAR